MNTSLTIPGKIQNTAPKPTKSQLMEALLARAKTAHQKAEAEKKIKRDALIAEVIALVLEGFKKAKPTADDVNLNIRWHTSDPTVNVSITSPQIKAIQKKIQNLKESHFDEDETKAKIREGLKAPNPLIGNDDVAKSLDQLLTTIMGAPKLETIDV